MRQITKLITFIFLLASLNLSTIPSAIAGCQDYPQSVTPECVLENLAIAKLLEEKRKADEVEGQRKVDEAARYWAEKSAADRAATTAADNALAPDDCARSTNTSLQRCIDARTEKARVENEAIDAVRKSVEIYDLQQSVSEKFFTNSCDEAANKLLQVCIDATIQKAAVEKAVDSANKNATITRDNTLAADDCARSTNQLLPRCIDDAVKEYIKIQVTMEFKRKMANDKFSVASCDQPINKILQVCLDAKIARDALENLAMNITKDLKNAQSLLTKPVFDSNGEVMLSALIKSKSLNSKEISTVMSTFNLNSSEKKSLSTYAQKLNSIKSTSLKTVNLPLSKTLSEEFSSATPKICTVTAGIVKTLKPGACILNISFATESGFEVQTTTKIAVKR